MTPSEDGKNWGISFTDDATKARWVTLTFTKAGCDDAVINWINERERQTSLTVKKLRFSGAEFMTRNLQDVCRAKGIVIEEASAYTPEHNGGSERSQGLIFTKGRALMEDGKLPPELWQYACETAPYLLNRSTTRALAGGMTPLQAYSIATAPDDPEHDKPDITNLRVFGCRAYVNIPKERRVQSQKFVPRAQVGKLIGYKSQSIYKIYLLEGGRVIETPHVTFNEEIIDDITDPDIEHDIDAEEAPVAIDPAHSLDRIVPASGASSGASSPRGASPGALSRPESPFRPLPEPHQPTQHGRRGSSIFRELSPFQSIEGDMEDELGMPPLLQPTVGTGGLRLDQPVYRGLPDSVTTSRRNNRSNNPSPTRRSQRTTPQPLSYTY